jgi:hypothetical protein
LAFKQRNYPRIDLVSPVSVTVNDHAVKGAVCLNISMGGMCIEANATFEEKQNGTVELGYEIYDEKIPFKGEFVVRWIKPGDPDKEEIQFGLQFTYYDSTNLTNLAKIIITQISKNDKTIQ